ncbi:MAG TPA: S-adenosylmethionine decarboxylase [Pyrinomonadaceae bacterium]|nr:S-adenosylmethionine decarboxylase [Pyrinomonadaceae bacterium]
MIVGTEWLIEATDCEPERLRDESLLRDLFDRVMSDLGLNAIGEVWHKFPGESGVTGMIALTESHLACHTYPEHGTATFNLYCCRTRREWDWESNLGRALCARTVSVTKIERGQGNPKSEISNFKFENSNPESESPNSKSKISNPKSIIQNPKSTAVGGDA